MIIRKLIITRFLSFNIVVQYNSDTMDFWCLFCSLTTQLECIAATFIWIVYQLDVAGVFFTQSTYFYQVYDDNRWWTSWYQTLRKGGTGAGGGGLAFILLISTISPLLFLPTVKYFLSRSNSQTTLMASNCWSLSSNHSIRSASSSVLNRRHTTVTTLFDTLLLSSTKCVCWTPSKPVRCVRTMFVKRRQIRSTHLLLLKLLWCRMT